MSGFHREWRCCLSHWKKYIWESRKHFICIIKVENLLILNILIPINSPTNHGRTTWYEHINSLPDDLVAVFLVTPTPARCGSFFNKISNPLPYAQISHHRCSCSYRYIQCLLSLYPCLRILERSKRIRTPDDAVWPLRYALMFWNPPESSCYHLLCWWLQGSIPDDCCCCISSTFSHRSLGLVLKRSPSSTSPHCYGSWWDDVQFLCHLSGVHRRSVLSTLRDMYSDHRDGIRTVDHDLEAEIISPKKIWNSLSSSSLSSCSRRVR